MGKSSSTRGGRSPSSTLVRTCADGGDYCLIHRSPPQLLNVPPPTLPIITGTDYPSPPDCGRLNMPSVLIIDDEPENLDILRRLFERDGWVATCLADSTRAVAEVG